MADLSVLISELETQKREDLAVIIEHARTPDYPKAELVKELKAIKLGFFAYKLETGVYDTPPKPYIPKHVIPETMMQSDPENAPAQPQEEPHV